jgi:hypothetical protein
MFFDYAIGGSNEYEKAVSASPFTGCPAPSDKK